MPPLLFAIQNTSPGMNEITKGSKLCVRMSRHPRHVGGQVRLLCKWFAAQAPPAAIPSANAIPRTKSKVLNFVTAAFSSNQFSKPGATGMFKC